MRDGRATNRGNQRKTHCHRGHPLSQAYLCRAWDGRTYRRCSYCDLDRKRVKKERRTAA